MAINYTSPVTKDYIAVGNHEACQIIRQAMDGGMLAALHGENGCDFDPNTGRVCAQGALFRRNFTFQNRDLQSQFVGMHDHWGKMVKCYGADSHQARCARQQFVNLLDRFDPPAQPHEVVEVLAKAMDEVVSDYLALLRPGDNDVNYVRIRRVPPQPEPEPKEKEPEKTQAADAARPSAGGVRQKELAAAAARPGVAQKQVKELAYA